MQQYLQYCNYFVIYSYLLSSHGQEATKIYESNCHVHIAHLKSHTPKALRGPYNVDLLTDHLVNTFVGTTDACVACSFVFTRPFSKLMSVKFQTFAYNSRTVWSSYMKF